MVAHPDASWAGGRSTCRTPRRSPSTRPAGNWASRTTCSANHGVAHVARRVGRSTGTTIRGADAQGAAVPCLRGASRPPRRQREGPPRAATMALSGAGFSTHRSRRCQATSVMYAPTVPKSPPSRPSEPAVAAVMVRRTPLLAPVAASVDRSGAVSLLMRPTVMASTASASAMPPEVTARRKRREVRLRRPRLDAEPRLCSQGARLRLLCGGHVAVEVEEPAGRHCGKPQVVHRLRRDERGRIRRVGGQVGVLHHRHPSVHARIGMSS